MKIVQINSVCEIGSTGRIMQSISKVLENNGHECLNIYSRKEASKDLRSYKMNSKTDTYINALHARITDREGFGTKRPTMRLLKVLDDYKPDLIQIHNLHGYYMNIKLLFEYIAEKKIPVVWTMHDEWCYTGHCAYTWRGTYTEDCTRWLTGCHDCPSKKEYPASFFLDNSSRNYSEKKRLFTAVDDMTMVTPSQWLFDRLKRSYLKEKDACVINNGINVNNFKPTESDFKKRYGIEDKFMVLGVSSIWVEKKGLADLIKLAQRLPEKFEVVIVGKTEEKLPENIIHINHTDSVSELAEIYSAADVFVNPTLCDNFPTVNLEALACGTPVITYNTGGSPEAVDKSCGIVIEQHDIDALADILNNFDRYDFKSENARKRAMNFTEEKAYNSYVDLYKKKCGI